MTGGKKNKPWEEGKHGDSKLSKMRLHTRGEGNKEIKNLSFFSLRFILAVSSSTTRRPFVSCFLFSRTPTQNPPRTLESGHYLTGLYVCANSLLHSPWLLSFHDCLPTLGSAVSYLLNICIQQSCLKISHRHYFSSKGISTHLRGPPSSYGGMMMTLTVTEVLSRSIICSWVSVTAATLQISTSRLPCLSPACQAKPYSSTCTTKTHQRRLQTSQLCTAKSLGR